MDYVGVVKNKEYDLEIHEINSDQYEIFLNEKKIIVDIKQVSDTNFSLICDNQVYDIEFEPDPNGGDNLLIRGEVVHIDIFSLREMRLKKVSQSSSKIVGKSEVKSPMPGKIVSVLISEGQKVEKGDGLFVIEAMKMENELKAPKDGTVKNVNVELGQSIEGSIVLCIVE